ncbi:aldose 1-epimerase family protein [Antarcticibacterium sp. 1MA-6-2]|uniref:aldose 1-epimerase family protein n=1 Tax=Antarcticibacterium sp. 1MA-6-2 TaxID=2908210 RepID=UPI001F293EEF|nr:aldose 1-epimerase family protein [Antarcticibacterium sp. 1MA-6-2]UJH92212.1 aldose 1-epimerase family protein [Antarcticibacterium sp. 1MA-6-2]
MHQLQNEFLSIGVKPIGAELCSIIDRETQKEYIWQANPEIWANHAPILFPIIGELKNGSYSFDGKEYSLPRHGFVRHNDKIILKEKTNESLIFFREYSEETLKVYPFKFQLEIQFTLFKKQLEISHRVTNVDDKYIYFSLGGHPAFNVPLNEGEVYEDHFLQFDKKLDLKTHVLNEEGLITARTTPVTENDDKIHLHKDLFNKDALVFKDIQSKKVVLKSKRSGPVLTVEYDDFKNLGLWANPSCAICLH